MLQFLRMGNKRTKTIWWVLIVITVVTFLGGFVFLLGSGLGTGPSATAGDVGAVDGRSVTRPEYQNAIAEQRMAYQNQYGTEPVDQDLRNLEAQAWRSLVYQRLLSNVAEQAGLTPGDAEVMFTLKVSPPDLVRSMPMFQTEGQFDYSKYQAALQDPNNNWVAFEEMARQQLPVRKLQERLIASVKVPAPELLEQYRLQLERIAATVVQVPPDMAGEAPTITDADLDKTLEKYRDRFVAAAHTELEVLSQPKKISEAEIASAREVAQSLAQRIRNGEDFATLAKDYSEGPAANNGGLIDRAFQPGEFDASLQAQLAAVPEGQIIDPFQDASRFVILRRAPSAPNDPPGTIRLAQIVTRVRSDEEEVRAQYEQLQKVRNQARKMGLGRAATANGLTTFSTGPFTVASPPAALGNAPEAVDWGLNAKAKEVSPVFEGRDEFVIVQVTRQEPAGLAPRAEIEPALRQLAEANARLQRSKPKADALAQAIAQGRSLEEAAAAQGLQSVQLGGMSRLQPDPRLSNVPEVVGALFGAPPGKTIGPLEGLDGWYFARVDGKMPADTTSFSAVRSQIQNELVQRRQRLFMSTYLNELRSRAKIQDLRIAQ